jgi:ribosomal-protein-serine acetyltransferase
MAVARDPAVPAEVEMLTYPLGDSAELRTLEPWQAAELAAHVDRARAHLEPWLPWAAAITGPESAREFLQRYADRQARDEGRIYGIWLGKELVGGTVFRIFDADAGNCEVGVWLAPEAQGRGLIIRAVRRMIDWAVHDRAMTRVEWHTVPGNTRSIAVARRLGMRREGVLRQAFDLYGTRHDVEIWALLADEWRQPAPG